MKKPAQQLEKLSERITDAVGTPQSIIIHTIIFVGIIALGFFGVPFNLVLLILTTLLSIEAIYLALFIQMTVNKTSESLEEVEEDVEDIVEEVKEDDITDSSIQESLAQIKDELKQIQAHLKR